MGEGAPWHLYYLGDPRPLCPYSGPVYTLWRHYKTLLFPKLPKAFATTAPDAFDADALLRECFSVKCNDIPEPLSTAISSVVAQGLSPAFSLRGPTARYLLLSPLLPTFGVPTSLPRRQCNRSPKPQPTCLRTPPPRPGGVRLPRSPRPVPSKKRGRGLLPCWLLLRRPSASPLSLLSLFRR